MKNKRPEHRIHRDFYFHVRKQEIIVLPNYYFGRYEMDLFCLNQKEEIVEYETKVTKQDYKIDFLKAHYEDKKLVMKHNLIKEGKRSNKFYFVVPEGLVTKEEVPDYCGLIYQRPLGGFRVVKRAPLLHDRKPELPFYKALVKTMAYRESNIRHKFYSRG
jgi:hypothetical protein